MSRNTLEDALAAFGEVTFFGALRCESELPPAVLDLLPVDLLLSVLDAAVAAFLPVTFRFATVPLLPPVTVTTAPDRRTTNILVQFYPEKTDLSSTMSKRCPRDLSAIRYQFPLTTCTFAKFIAFHDEAMKEEVSPRGEDW